jgi:hypothetical protein
VFQIVAQLREIADDYEQRGKETDDIVKQAAMIDVAVKARFLISEIAKLFEAAKQMEAA